jgi:hypothetical protein
LVTDLEFTAARHLIEFTIIAPEALRPRTPRAAQELRSFAHSHQRIANVTHTHDFKSITGRCAIVRNEHPLASDAANFCETTISRDDLSHLAG